MKLTQKRNTFYCSCGLNSRCSSQIAFMTSSPNLTTPKTPARSTLSSISSSPIEIIRLARPISNSTVSLRSIWKRQNNHLITMSEYYDKCVNSETCCMIEALMGSNELSSENG
jgi:hypothetical protein